jgi:hypothetical protein
VGVIKYPLTRRLPGTVLRHSEKRLPTCEMEQQTDKASSPDNRIHSAAGDRLIFDRSDDPDIQKLALCEQKRDGHECQEVRPEIDNKKFQEELMDCFPLIQRGLHRN